MEGHRTSQPSTPHLLADVLVDSDSGEALAALETICDAGKPLEAVADAAPPHRANTELRPTGQLIPRLSTPERIRRASARLYEDIHMIMDRHDARSGRELELQRRYARHSKGTNRAGRATGTAQSTAVAAPRSSPQEKTTLPDVQQMFEESRRFHLEEAQQQRKYFPSSSKPTVYSSKDPGTFSYRFQLHPADARDA